MPKRLDIHKILVIGSGPIVIGQAAEFDYAGTQACLAIKEEGYEVILVNSNPATIMTDKEVADKVYMEPLTVEFLTQVIRKERPDAILPTLGGQTGLNLTKFLAEAGVLAQYEVEVLGTPLAAINQAEDRELFKSLMAQLNHPTPESVIVEDVESAVAFAQRTAYPVIVRPAFTLGGSGGGICQTEADLRNVVKDGLNLSPVSQCLIEQSIAGYKEIEFEVMRDSNDGAIVVCCMENFDPVGVHTGDSIVFAPSQTLSDVEYQLLRDASLDIIRTLKIEGGCNVQLALDPASYNYYVIEVNPRVSRSSALASKATGYPIARIAAKIALGYRLDELINPVTQQTYAHFEPALDYVVAKLPRFAFDKFEKADRRLGTQMKATGEVMAIGRTLEEAFLKAVRSLEVGLIHPTLAKAETLSVEELKAAILQMTDERIYYIFAALRQGVTVEMIHHWTQIDAFFLDKLLVIVEMEERLSQAVGDKCVLKQAKQAGFADATIAHYWKTTTEAVRQLRMKKKILPVYKMVDTCAGEFDAATTYYYSSYEAENESLVTSKPSVLILGSGPIRIGQGVEFDYATVHSVKAVQALGYEAIVMNSNPETVSTDYAISDKLYFEPLTLEDVLHVIDLEQPIGVIVQFGGQTAINLAEGLAQAGVKILGTSVENLAQAEDRQLFEEILNQLAIPRPIGATATSVDQAVKIAQDVGYPVLVRPSFVLGGRAMEIVNTEESLRHYMGHAVSVSPDQPVLVDHYVQGLECEVDAIFDGEAILLPGIMEHIERSGVHSGDSMAIYPPQSLSDSVKVTMIDYTKRLAKALGCLGMMNIQFIVQGEQVYIIEVNPRASRTVPFLSKVTGIPMAQVATRVILGESLADQGYADGLYPESDRIHVKAPVFSFKKLHKVDSQLGPEMKSTGEAIGSDISLEKALYKAFKASNIDVPMYGNVLFTIADEAKEEALVLAKRFHDLGYHIQATRGTAAYLSSQGLSTTLVEKVSQALDNSVVTSIEAGQTQFVINVNGPTHLANSDGVLIRRAAIENNIPLFTSLDTVEAILKVIESLSFSVEAL